MTVNTHTPSYLFTVQWVFERISSVRLHISAERHYFFPQFLLAEIWVFDLFKMQSDSPTPESEREAHDCATKFEGLNAVTHRERRAALHLPESWLGYGDTITPPRVMLIFKDGLFLCCPTLCFIGMNISLQPWITLSPLNHFIAYHFILLGLCANHNT